MNGELSEETKLMLRHPELIEPVMACVVRFHQKTGKLPEFLFVSMDVWNSLGRARRFEGMLVICNLKLKGKAVVLHHGGNAQFLERKKMNEQQYTNQPASRTSGPS